MIYRALRLLLFLLPAEAAHGLALAVLRWLGRRPALRRRLRAAPLPELASRRFGLAFDNPLGLAAGLDKDGSAAAGLFALGFGFVEVGTWTPRPQPGNPRPRLFRVPKDRALVNRMGFNNLGVEVGVRRLAGTWRPGPLGINLGKNRDTPEADAIADYEFGLRATAGWADYLVVNVSSPNSPGLRRLQDPERLTPLLGRLQEVNRELGAATGHRPPLLLKVSPDLDDSALEELVDRALDAGVDGLIATNTTLARPSGVPPYGEAGGLSGRPLAERSLACLRVAVRRARGRLPVVSVGGIFTADEVFERLRAGACLVQLYTGLVYEGPGLVGRLARGLAERMRREGFRDLDDLVGSALARPSRRGAGSRPSLR